MTEPEDRESDLRFKIYERITELRRACELALTALEKRNYTHASVHLYVLNGYLPRAISDCAVLAELTKEHANE